MTTIETQRDQLQAFKDHIESSKAKFDSVQKIEFQRRETAYYAAQRAKKILEGECSEIEKILDKLVKEQNIFYAVFVLLMGVATTFLAIPILLFLGFGLTITFVYLKSRISQFRILRVTTVHQILFYDTETNKALRGYLRYEEDSGRIRRDESFRKSLESEEIILIQDLYEAEVQVAIINAMPE